MPILTVSDFIHAAKDFVDDVKEFVDVAKDFAHFAVHDYQPHVGGLPRPEQCACPAPQQQDNKNQNNNNSKSDNATAKSGEQSNANKSGMAPKEGETGGPGAGKRIPDQTKGEALKENQAANGGRRNALIVVKMWVKARITR